MICKNCGKENTADARFCAACGATLEAAPATPAKATWLPGVISSYKNGWNRLWKNFLELFLIWLITFGVGLFNNIIPVLMNVFVEMPIQYGASFAYLKAARGDSLQVKDMFDVFRNYLNAVLAGFLVMIITLIGFVLLIIPGIYFACKLSFTPYLIVDRKMEAIPAIKESWRLTNGHFWKIFLTGLLAIPILIGGAICLGLGIIISFMWIDMAFASLYHSVTTSGTPSPAPGAGAPAA